MKCTARSQVREVSRLFRRPLPHKDQSTDFEDLLKLGWTPVLMLLAESVWIAAFAASGLLLTP